MLTPFDILLEFVNEVLKWPTLGSLLVFVTGILSWVAFAKRLPDTYNYGNKVFKNFTKAVGQAHRGLMRVPALRRSILIIVTFVVSIAQAVTVVLCFIAANIVAMSFDTPRLEAFARVVEGHAYEIVVSKQFFNLLEFDVLSVGFLVLSIGMVWGAYIFPGIALVGALLITLPALICIALGFLGLLCASVMLFLMALLDLIGGSIDWGGTIAILSPIFIVMLISAIYCALCYLSGAASIVLAQTWNDETAPR